MVKIGLNCLNCRNREKNGSGVCGIGCRPGRQGFRGDPKCVGKVCTGEPNWDKKCGENQKIQIKWGKSEPENQKIQNVRGKCAKRTKRSKLCAGEPSRNQENQKRNQKIQKPKKGGGKYWNVNLIFQPRIYPTVRKNERSECKGSYGLDEKKKKIKKKFLKN